MNDSIFSGRRLAATLLAFATFVVMALATASTATAQNCGPCAGSSVYKLEVINWPAALGFASASVDVTDRGTGSSTTYSHQFLSAGSSTTQKFSATNPTHNYDLTTVTLSYCSDHIIYQVYCYDNGGPVTQCFPIICQNNAYCVQITYTKGVAGVDPYCWKITLNAIAGSCPLTGCANL